jgi:hypothetical protein
MYLPWVETREKAEFSLGFQASQDLVGSHAFSLEPGL